MAVITIDGTRLEVPENKNVLECALEAGIYIPHLCHHPDLPENGSCRMCIVEVEGQEGVTTSCTLRAQDGMVVHTTSERINKLRTLALELLLAGHPEDCSTCPKYGNCELQTLIQYIGANNARMRTRIKGIKMEEGNPLLIHDMNRCVLCGRCVRACNKLRGVGVLQYNKKELETYVGTLHGKLLKDEDCRFCTACAEVCPTEPKTLECGENHLLKPEFNIIPSKRQFIIDDYLCIRCKKCMKQCPVGAIHVEDDGKVVVNPFKCISCGECLDVCPVNGAMKGVFVDNIQDQKELIAQVVTFLEKYINNKEEDLRSLKKDRLLQYNFPLSDIFDKALEISLELLT